MDKEIDESVSILFPQKTHASIPYARDNKIQ